MSRRAQLLGMLALGEKTIAELASQMNASFCGIRQLLSLCMADGQVVVSFVGNGSSKSGRRYALNKADSPATTRRSRMDEGHSDRPLKRPSVEVVVSSAFASRSPLELAWRGALHQDA